MNTSFIDYTIEFTEFNEQIKEALKKLSKPSKRKWNNCKLFNTDDCPNIENELMKRFLNEISNGHRYLTTFSKKIETEINEKFVNNCDSFVPF